MVLSPLFLVFVFMVSQNYAQIEFQIGKVPRYYTPLNDVLYISGTFNGWIVNSSSYALTRLSYEKFKIILDLPKGTYEYKFTRGSWSNNETSINGEFLPNRELIIESDEPQMVNITIENWKDMIGNHTATENVYFLHSQFPYPQFNRTKRIWIYLPIDYFTTANTNKTYSVVYMPDGQNLFDVYYNPTGLEWSVDETMDKFYLENNETSIVVAVETQGTGIKGERVDELTPFVSFFIDGGKGNLFLEFIVNFVKPHIDQTFRTSPGREHTVIIGSSLGGLFSIYAGLTYQSMFSKIGSISPAFIVNPEIYDLADNVTKEFDDSRIYFSCGDQEEDILPTVESDMIYMYDGLKKRGFPNVNFTIFHCAKHNEEYWRLEFLNAYKWIFDF